MERLKALLFPPKCASCAKLLDFEKVGRYEALCRDCLSSFRDEQKEICLFCGQRVSDCTCVTELIQKAGCERLLKMVYYRHGRGDCVQNRMIFRIKNKRDLRTTRFFAKELAEEIRVCAKNGVFSLQDAVVTYIPRRRRAVLERGTDQAKALAVAIAKELDLQAAPCLVRSRAGQKEQKTLSPKERLRNARASFSVKHDALILNRTVLLVDDIVTTGASLAAATRKLLHAGAGCVICVAASSDDCNRAPLSPNSIKTEK